MQAIFNRQGYTVGWLSGTNIYDRRGYFIGFLKTQAVYNYRCEYRGNLQKSFFRDLSGNVVAFLIDAKNGPSLPSLKAIPIKPIIKIPKTTKVAPPPKSAPQLKFAWSNIGWNKYLL